MSKRKKILILCGSVIVLAIIILASMNSSRKNTVLVQTSKVQKKDILTSKVTASGELRAKNFVDLQSEIAGIITDLPVHEGASVKKGQVLLRIDPIQTEAENLARKASYDAQMADARAQEFVIRNAEATLLSNEAALTSARAELTQAESNFGRARSSYKRKQQLHEDGLIATDDYESAQNEYRVAQTRLDAAQAQLTRAETQIRVARNTIEQNKTNAAASVSRAKSAAADLTRSTDQLKKTTLFAPLDGVITKLQVEKGERAQPGIMSNPEATLMTIADLSVIQAEIKVDETDIINLSIGDITSVKVDALPDDVFQGEVTEIGNSPIQSSASSQEAKDFKVVVTLKAPSSKLRPGMSCTADITTDTKRNVLVIPIQALTVRDVEVDKDGKYHPPDLNKKGAAAVARADSTTSSKKELEGVFIIEENNTARFRPIETGLTGESEIEVLGNLKEGDEIVSGAFQTLRTIKDGATVKIDKSVKSEKKS